MSVDGFKRSLANGRYKVIAQIATGGMATVYRAYDTQNDRDVAIKVLLFDLVGEESFLRRFQRESEMMRDLDHPNILRAYDFGQDGDSVYLVMSYYGGGTLKDRIVKGRGVASLAKAADYLDQIAAGLGYAHARGIVHRDMKPSNILIHHAEERLVISDFGIAKALGPLAASRTGTGNIMGTPRYMAPEQFLDRVDRRSDIYAVGVMLYEMLVGRPPFSGDGLGFKHMRELPPPLADAGSGRSFDPAIEAVVQKALAKNPDDRFQAAEDMAQAFRAAVERQLAHDPRSGDAPASGVPFAPQSGSFIGLALPADRLRSRTPAININPPPPRNELETKPDIQQQPTQLNSYNSFNLASTDQRGYGFIAEVPITEPSPLTPTPTIRAAPARRKRGRTFGISVAVVLLLSVAIAVGAFFLLNQSSTAQSGLGTPSVVASTGPTTQATSAATQPPTTAPASTTLPPTTGVPVVPVQSTPTPNGFHQVSIAYVINPKEASDNVTGIALYDVTTHQSRIVVDIPPAHPTDIATRANPSWTSDGQRLYYHSDQNGPLQLFLAVLQNTGAINIPLNGKAAKYPAVSPQGNQLAFVSAEPADTNAIYIGAADGQNTTFHMVVPPSDKETSGPAWSLNLRYIAYSRRDANNISQVWIVDLSNANKLTQLTNFRGTTQHARFPTWSPSGKQITFSIGTEVQIPEGTTILPSLIYTMNADGTNQKAITDETARHAGRPFWACDSTGQSRIYFNSDKDTNPIVGGYRSQLYSMKPDGTNQTPVFLHDDGNNDYNPAVYVSPGCTS